MSILVFVEGTEGEIKKSSREAVSYAAEMGKMLGDDQVVAVSMGDFDQDLLASLGVNGATKVIHFNDAQLNEHQIGLFSDLLMQAIERESGDVVIMTKSAFSDNVGGRVAAKMGAAIVSNVVSLPDVSSGFTLRKSIFTGKAFSTESVSNGKKVIIIKKNTIEISENGATAAVETADVSNMPKTTEKITGNKKAEGDVLLDDADIVVSGGRGLKGPENWGIIEDLANALGAATGCSKPVSDIGWRPHHEHVGQTGVKVSPNLYIAVGISGAIQHLAGVNSSKVLVAINIDPEAPFFKAADYGIVGDAFDVVPRLIEKVKSL